MRVYQWPLNVQQMAYRKDDEMFALKWAHLCASEMVVDSKVVAPVVTDFTGAMGLLLIAKDMKTMVNGLKKAQSKGFGRLTGSVGVWFGQFGDSSEHKNITLTFLGGKFRQAVNTLKYTAVALHSVGERAYNQVLARLMVASGLISDVSQANSLTRSQKTTNLMGLNIGFDVGLWREGVSWSDVSEKQRQDNLGRSRIVAFIYPRKFAECFDGGGQTTFIDNGHLSFASIASALSTQKPGNLKGSLGKTGLWDI
jgi:hypothetical protein